VQIEGADLIEERMLLRLEEGQLQAAGATPRSTT
jgi:hypothetical protein